MTKKISDESLTPNTSTNGQLMGFSSGIWETSEIMVGDNESNNFCSILLFPSEKDVYSSGSSDCAVSEYKLRFVFSGQSLHWKFEKNTMVHYLMINNSVIDNIPMLSSPCIQLLRQYQLLKLTDAEFDRFQYEFDKISCEMASSNPLEQIVYDRTTIIFAEASRIVQNSYDIELI